MKLIHLSDSVLVANFRNLLIEQRELLVQQLEYVAELDRRKLFFEHSSLFAYLVDEHGLEDSFAVRLIRISRLFPRFPEIKEKLQSGKLNPTLLELAMGCASREKLGDLELAELMNAISGMSCRRAQREIATRFPESVELRRDRVRPITAEHSEVRFVADQGLLDKLEEIRGLLAHSHPYLSMAELIDVLATEYRERHHPEEKAKRAQARKLAKEANPEVPEQVGLPAAPRVNPPIESPEKPKEESYIPSQPLVHKLVLSQGYRCSYVDPVTQKRCRSQYALERHHLIAWANGGKTTLGNLQYLCRNHHRRISFLEFEGRWRKERRLRA